MSQLVKRASGPAATADSEGGRGCYLYGIVRAGTRTPGGPDGAVTLVRHGQLAALVRPDQHWPVQPTRQGLLGHARLLDRLAETDPVLPMRFGTVLDSPAAVEAEVLTPHHDAFLAALTRLAGQAQFLVAARYQMDVVVRQVLAEQPALLRLHRRLLGASGEPDPMERMRLGELVARAVAEKRMADTAALVAALRPHAAAGRVLDLTRAGEDGVAELAVLVEHRHRDRFETAAEQLARRWHGRVRLRLRGPMAPYHFVEGLAGARPEGR
jgi:Gas vesicle synthesis protein GvpL/GvpF